MSNYGRKRRSSKHDKSWGTLGYVAIPDIENDIGKWKAAKCYGFSWQQEKIRVVELNEAGYKRYVRVPEEVKCHKTKKAAANEAKRLEVMNSAAIDLQYIPPEFISAVMSGSPEAIGMLGGGMYGGSLGVSGAGHRPSKGSFLSSKMTAVGARWDENNNKLKYLNDAFKSGGSKLFPGWKKNYRGDTVGRGDGSYARRMMTDFTGGGGSYDAPSISGTDRFLRTKLGGNRAVSRGIVTGSGFGSTAFAGRRQRRMIDSAYFGMNESSFGRRRRSNFGKINYGFSRYF